MDNFVVTFARGFGTGGKAIASQLAKMSLEYTVMRTVF